MIEEVRNKIATVQEQMKLDHRRAQETLSHSGNKGSMYEHAFREALAKCLPVSLQFGHGEIVDSLGHRSNQTDVVIVSRDHPGTFSPDLPELFYVEAVLAAGEIKAILTSDELDRALQKSETFKHLQIVPQNGALALGNPGSNRYFRCPPFFLLAYESQLKIETVSERILAYQNCRGLRPGQLVDAVFLLDRGWLINFGDGAEEFKFKLPDGRSLPGWIHEPSSDVLLTLITWLSVVMPKFVYQPPIMQLYLDPQRK
jgi:Domain of unknown function (DUF6602)